MTSSLNPPHTHVLQCQETVCPQYSWRQWEEPEKDQRKNDQSESHFLSLISDPDPNTPKDHWGETGTETGE
jgi:hypothetical protein